MLYYESLYCIFNRKRKLSTNCSFSWQWWNKTWNPTAVCTMCQNNFRSSTFLSKIQESNIRATSVTNHRFVELSSDVNILQRSGLDGEKDASTRTERFLLCVPSLWLYKGFFADKNLSSFVSNLCPVLASYCCTTLSEGVEEQEATPARQELMMNYRMEL